MLRRIASAFMLTAATLVPMPLAVPPPPPTVVGTVVWQLQAGIALPSLPRAYQAELAVLLSLYDEAQRETQERAWKRHINLWIEQRDMERYLEGKR